MIKRSLIFIVVVGIFTAVIVAAVFRIGKSRADKKPLENSAISTISSTTVRTIPTTTGPIAVVNVSVNRTTYASRLTRTSPFICHVGFCTTWKFYIEPVFVTVSVTGIYKLFTQSNIDTLAILYSPVFDIRFVFKYSIASNNDGGGNGQFNLQRTFQSNQSYILLVAGYASSVTGPFTLVGEGPGLLNFTHVTNLTPLNFAVNFNISSQLTTASPKFCRTGPCSNPTNYYHTIRFNITTFGIYGITSRSILDMYGILYREPFAPENPLNGIADSDTSGGNNGQFCLFLYLQPGIQYTLITTTDDPGDYGAFTLNFYGAGPIIMDL